MKVLIISGFLGAGKTTFIKELRRRTGKQFVVLENEYGEANLDAKEIESVAGMKVYEFSDGCVCCTMKDGFASSLVTISSSLDPEYLIVEPTGIGKLGNIINTVKSYEYEHITLIDPITILSPKSFDEYNRQYPDIYINQIQNAGRIVFSKCENEDESVILRTVEKIREMSPNAEVIPSHYSKYPNDWWEKILLSSRDNILEEPDIESDIAITSPRELTLMNTSLPHPGMMIQILDRLIKGNYGEIIRAKGVVRTPEAMLRFDVADGCYGIIEEENQKSGQSVFIGFNIKDDVLKGIFSPAKNSKKIKF